MRIRFSVIIQNKKNEFLICACPHSNIEMNRYEFIGGEIAVDIMPPFEQLFQQITAIVYEKIDVEIEEIQEFEMYRDYDFLWCHAILSAKIKSGNPRKQYYTKLLWLPLNKIDVDKLNTYGLQVFNVINECSYCDYIHDSQNKLDDFFSNFFDRQEENLAVLETLEVGNGECPAYRIAFKQEMLHLRASLIENVKLKKNITVQNYFRLYGRDDLAEKIDALLKIEVRAGLFLKDMIKESVDKYIAHYDEPSAVNDEIYKYCISIFSANGKLPLKKFIVLLDGYIMSLIMEMWYDAGELGVTMSERCSGQRQIIIDHGNNFASELIQALVIEKNK